MSVHIITCRSAWTPTLCAHQDDGDFCSIAIVRHFGVVVIDGIETGLILQAEDKDDGIHPVSELSTNKQTQ